MKKLALGALLCASGLFAGGMDLDGIITAVDNNNKTITINGFVVQILPQTKIKLDDIAEEVELKCVKNRAY